MGQASQADAAFDRADRDSSSFGVAYHRAARSAEAGPEGAAKCLEELSRIETSAGFEKQSVDYLKGICGQWKSAK
jgi:hypothetical protein